MDDILVRKLGYLINLLLVFLLKYFSVLMGQKFRLLATIN